MISQYFLIPISSSSYIIRHICCVIDKQYYLTVSKVYRTTLYKHDCEVQTDTRTKKSF